MPLRIAYLNSQYPSLSHTFIEREIRGLRALGVEIDTFSINPPRPQDTLGERHASEARSTFILKPSKGKLLASQLGAFLSRPLGYLRALRESQKLFPPGLKSRATALGYLMEAARLVRELDRRKLRHLHVHMANNGAAVALLARAMDPRLAYSLSIHGSAEFFDVHRLNLRQKTGRAAFVRCISDFCKAQVMAWSSPESWTHFHVVHCAVDPRVLTPPSGGRGQGVDSLRSPSGLREGVPSDRGPQDRGGGGPLRLLTVGRLDPIKGYPLLLEALAKVVKTHPNIRLEMVGSGPLEQRLKDQVHRLNLGSVVSMPGPLSAEDMPQAYTRSDVLIVSSFMEGVPVVLMEAMSMGLLVLSTAVGGVPELVTHNVNGLIVRPGSVDALASAIRDLADRHSQDPARLQPMRDAARETILREFNVEQQAVQMRALFERYVSPS